MSNHSNFSYIPSANFSLPPTSLIGFNCALITITVSSLVIHGFVLIILLTNRKLWTPFNIYIVNVLVFELIHTFLEKILIVFENAAVRRDLCVLSSAVNYCMYCILPISRFAHVLITLNRLWALFLPSSYSRKHTRKMAVAFCVGSAVVIQMCGGATAIAQALTSPFWMSGRTSILFVLALQHAENVFSVLCGLFMAGTFPCLYVKYRGRMEERAALQQHIQLATINRQRAVSAERAEKACEEERGPFFFLTALTLTVLLTWIPMDLYMIYAMSVEYEYDREYVLVQLWASVLIGLQMLTDPVFLVLTLRDVKAVVKKAFADCIGSGIWHGRHPLC